MPQFRGKIHLSIVLTLNLEADSALEASTLIDDHENKILSRLWEAPGADPRIKQIFEVSYASSKAVGEVPEGVKLG